MNIDHFISEAVSRSVEALYGPLGEEQLQIQKTRKEFDGDYTLVVFPLLRRSRKSPEATAAEIGEHLTAHMPEVKSFNVIKGFLNLALSDGFWADRFAEIAADGAFGQAPATGRNVMIEYSSPNTTSRSIWGISATTCWAIRSRRYCVPSAITSSRSTWSTTAASTSASRCWRGSATAEAKRPLRRE